MRATAAQVRVFGAGCGGARWAEQAANWSVASQSLIQQLHSEGKQSSLKSSLKMKTLKSRSLQTKINNINTKMTIHRTDWIHVVCSTFDLRVYIFTRFFGGFLQLTSPTFQNHARQLHWRLHCNILTFTSHTPLRPVSGSEARTCSVCTLCPFS